MNHKSFQKFHRKIVSESQCFQKFHRNVVSDQGLEKFHRKFVSDQCFQKFHRKCVIVGMIFQIVKDSENRLDLHLLLLYISQVLN